MKIEILYPEICNMYGDSRNAVYLRESFPDAFVQQTMLNSKPLFATENVDIIYIGSLPEVHQPRIIEQLKPYKMRLWQLIESGTVLLVTGNACDLFGRDITCEGKVTPAIGMFDYHVTHDKENRHNSVFVGQFEDITITGWKTTFSTTSGLSGKPLFKVIKGHGTNGSDTDEGILYRNCMMTYVIGPLLPMNPQFVARIMERIGYDGHPAFEEEAQQAHDYRLAQMTAPGAHTDLNFHGV